MKRPSQKGKTNPLVTVTFILCILSVVCMITVLCLPNREVREEFVPPEFDEEAVVGTPAVPEGVEYGEPGQIDADFTVKFCRTVRMDGTRATVYFTNPAENNVWLKLRVTDENGSVLGETGLIRPGEYIVSMTLSTSLEAGIKIKLKAMAYEPETYHSAGAMVLNTVVEAEH